MKLFQSIFGRQDRVGSTYPEWLIEAAVERAVEATDPRLKFVSGFRKRLRGPVIRAIDHVVGLIDAIPEPVAAGPREYPEASCLGAMFASSQGMLEALGRDAELRDYLSGPGVGAARITALVLAELVEKKGLGVELVDDRIQREVAQVTVSFSAHRLLDPTDDEVETRRLLKRRAFDHLLTLALKRIVGAKVDRADLRRQRDLLRRKLKALESGGWSFDAPESEHPTRAALEDALDGITQQLDALGAESRLLESHLVLLSETLEGADTQLWGSEVELFLDPMNIQRAPSDAQARRVVLQQLHNVLGRRVVMLPISFSPRDLPPRQDFARAAERYLS
ncbi:hypothetical protein G3480_18370 [Thiorhodococcus mannitoliphagus]|uniref:Uncharacterized protein n=1 Tax=Thiorhodococcus mannitoliphagus TaxID=329406 RepID=A0A6P1DZR2_9GAMM|nr:hypothetical protein [Thiorhodococcus mannitoliphagus]NEX22246.1 hypothetical protein [Thiorhodococcus mannitoliphagus]